MFYSLAAGGDLEGLEIWQLAGVDLTMTSYDGQTPIEVVSYQDVFRHTVLGKNKIQHSNFFVVTKNIYTVFNI